MVLREEHAQVEGLLLDAITSLCESRVTFHNTLAIRAEVVLTADDQEPFCVNLDHVLKTSTAVTSCDAHSTGNETPVLTNDDLDTNLPTSEVNDCTDPAINDDQNSLEQDLRVEAPMQSDEQRNIVGEEPTPSETDDISLTLSSIKQEILEAQQENPLETPTTNETPQIDTKFEVTNGDESESRDRSPSPEPPSPPPTTLKRKRGRPPKDKSQAKPSDEDPGEKKPVGRPRKQEVLPKMEPGESPVEKRRRGRPRKESVTVLVWPDGVKRPRGRPRKGDPKVIKVKTKCKKYNFKERVEIVKEAERNGIEATCQRHNISPCTLEALEKQVLLRERTKNGRLPDKGRKVSEEHDKIVVEWILAERELGRSLKPEHIMRYAKQIISAERPHFRASHIWLQKFMQRNRSALGENTNNYTSLECATTGFAMPQESEEDESMLAQNNSSADWYDSQMASCCLPQVVLDIDSKVHVPVTTLLDQMMMESASQEYNPQFMDIDGTPLMASVSDISRHSPLLTQLKTESSETAVDVKPIIIQPVEAADAVPADVDPLLLECVSVPPCPPLTRPDGSKTY